MRLSHRRTLISSGYPAVICCLGAGPLPRNTTLSAVAALPDVGLILRPRRRAVNSSLAGITASAYLRSLRVPLGNLTRLSLPLDELDDESSSGPGLCVLELEEELLVLTSLLELLDLLEELDPITPDTPNVYGLLE